MALPLLRCVWLGVLAGFLAGCSTGRGAHQSATPQPQAQAAAPTPAPAPAPAPVNDIAPGQRETITAELTAHALTPRVWRIVHEQPWPANSVVAELDDGTLLLVDTPYTPAATSELLAWLRARYGERPLVAINTHFHYDRVGGNAALVGAGARVYASELTVAHLDAHGDRQRNDIMSWLDKEGRPALAAWFRGWDVTRPTHTFVAAQGLVLRFGKDQVRVVYPGPAHAPDNVVVHLPEHRLLVGGCMILGQDRMGNRSDADMARWRRALDVLEPLDFAILIPGHGDRVDRGLLALTRQVVERTLAEDARKPAK